MARTSPYMRRALELARRGEGLVEPNPMVGCVVVQQDQIVGEGWHAKFGGPHAEVEALRQAADRAPGATIYVTLEPCCHEGKTGPCTKAIQAAGIARVVVAERDPFPQVAGRGIQTLRAAGIEVEVGFDEEVAGDLTAPYRKLLIQEKPWVIGKWAMTLDGKIATSSGDSKWISNQSARQVAHRLRGRVDAVLVGNRTARLDDPLLTARPAGPRTAARVVFDSHCSLQSSSQLVRTARQTPTIVVASDADSADQERLRQAGCEVLLMPAASKQEQLQQLLLEFGRRRFTNVLIEGGGSMLGTAFDCHALDEVHVFIAPKLVGGEAAPGPLAGNGLASIGLARTLTGMTCQELEGNLYLQGRLASGPSTD